jgi:hypothetical protein
MKCYTWPWTWRYEILGSIITEYDIICSRMGRRTSLWPGRSNEPIQEHISLLHDITILPLVYAATNV